MEKIRRHGDVLLYILALILLVPNVMNLFVYSVESSEAFSVKMGNMHFGEMLGATANEIHPPLYYAMLQFWIAVFGNVGVAYRALSLIPYLLSVLYALVFLRKEFGHLCAAVFLACTSLVTTALIYNTHIRNYSWPAFCVLMCYHELYLILRDGRRKNYVLLAVFSVLAGYLLYYALLPAGLCYLYLLIVLIAGKRKEELKNWMLSALLAIAVYLPWLIVFFRTLQSLGGWYWMQEVEPFINFYKSIFSARFSMLWPSLWLLLTAYLLYRDFRKKEGNDAGAAPALSQDTHWILAGVFVVFGAIAVGFLVSVIVRPLFNPRYLYPASPVAWLSLAAAVGKLKFRKRVVPVCLAVFLVFQMMSFAKTWQRRSEEDQRTRETVETVSAKNVQGAFLLSEYPPGGHDDEIILKMGFTPGPVTEYYFRGMADEVRIDPADPGSWELSEGMRGFLFLRETLSEAEQRILKERGFLVELLVEDGYLCFKEFVVYYLEPSGDGA